MVLKHCCFFFLLSQLCENGHSLFFFSPLGASFALIKSRRKLICVSLKTFNSCEDLHDGFRAINQSEKIILYYIKRLQVQSPLSILV